MKFLDPYIMYLKLAAIAALVAGAVYLTRDHYTGVIAKKDLDLAAKSAELIKTKNDFITKAGEQHATDQETINALRNLPPRVVRIHVPISSCGDAKGTPDQDRATRLLSEKIDSALAEVREGDRTDAFRCDQLNIDAIASNAANK
jgi:hypothetical protein